MATDKPATIEITQARTAADLEGIISLQQQNLAATLTDCEISSQGFVTVTHQLADLAQMNAIESHVIAKAGDKVVGYVLAMTPQSADNIPVLKPMFVLFQEIAFDNRKISDFKYLVVGQVCVDKMYRGTGLLDNCYAFYKKSFQDRYDFAITEIAANNLRSLAAHQRIGFRKIYCYTAPDQQDWVIVIWDWRR